MRIAAFVTALLCSAPQLAWAWEQPFVEAISKGDALEVTPDGSGSLSLIVWGAKALSVVVTTTLLAFTARRLSDGEYDAALRSFVAAMIAGASPFFAETLFF